MYKSETEKIRPIFNKYFKEGMSVIDIGCGADKIVPKAIGVDGRKLDTVDYVIDLIDIKKNLANVGMTNQFDIVFSSHCLEHLPDDIQSLKDWIDLTKTGGYVFLYLPCDTKYDNKSNPEHLHYYTRDSFLSKMGPHFNNVELIESNDHYGEQLYSFYIVLKKV